MSVLESNLIAEENKIRRMLESLNHCKYKRDVGFRCVKPFYTGNMRWWHCNDQQREHLCCLWCTLEGCPTRCKTYAIRGQEIEAI